MVEDRGDGISPEIGARIFEPLFSTKGEKGRGIGLALATAVAALLGGDLELEALTAGGTRATLRFPAPEAPAAAR